MRGAPAGATLTFAEPSEGLAPPSELADGSWLLLTGGTSLSATVEVVPATFTSASFVLTFIATAAVRAGTVPCSVAQRTALSNCESAEASIKVRVSPVATAQPPILDLTPTRVTELLPAKLVGGVQCDTNGTVACLVDTDGSETLELWFFGLPNTFTFSKGRRQKSVRDGDELGWRLAATRSQASPSPTPRGLPSTPSSWAVRARSTEGGETAKVEVETTFNVRRDCANGLAIEPPLGPVSG